MSNLQVWELRATHTFPARGTRSQGAPGSLAHLHLAARVWRARVTQKHYEEEDTRKAHYCQLTLLATQEH